MGVKTRIGGFLVQPIKATHSCECYSFIIQHDDIGKLLFVTDTSEFRYKVKDCNHIIMEANWSEEVLIDNLCNDEATRSRHSDHMELEETLAALRANNNPFLQNVILCHLSSGNSNEEMFVKKAKSTTPFSQVCCAKEKLVLTLQKEEF